MERLEQTCTLAELSAEGMVFDHESPTFNFTCQLRYNAAALVIEYPGIAVRHG